MECPRNNPNKNIFFIGFKFKLDIKRKVYKFIKINFNTKSLIKKQNSIFVV